MAKSTLVLLALSALVWGQSSSMFIETEDDASVSAISGDVNKLKYLYYPTLDNQVEIDFNNRQTLESAQMRSDLPLVIIIDGFLSNSTSPMTRLLRETFVNSGGRNVIVLDWSKLSGAESYVGNPIMMAAAYLTVLGNVGPIGRRLAEFLELVRDEKGIPLSDVTLVGGSLGAHIAGAAGTTIRNKYGEPQVGEIIALDPAGPFFTMQIDRDKRVHRGDARFVAIYHSNRGTLGDSDHDTGDINVYINGGDNQPGCEEADKANSGTCSHSYAFQTFNLGFGGNVRACPCAGNAACTCNDCKYECENPISLGPNTSHDASGRYHASVNEVFYH